ncbi:MAG TPA: cellulase family glycosylhydrolase, partial [Burkholderiales bacterium]|nr:cellulase family glycosylhydrolase [Burkholderiales bacterium]
MTDFFRLGYLALGLLIGTSASADEFMLGVSAHYGLDMGNPTASMPAIEGAGFNSFRDEIQWSRVEKEAGQLKLSAEVAKVDKAVELANARGIEPLLILCYGNKVHGGGFPLSDDAKAAFVRYAEFLARHYKGKVRYWELWNEWNQGLGNKQNLEGRRAARYAELLKAVYPALKKIDPNIVVLGGAVEGAGSTGWIEDLFDADAGKYMDGLSVHPYVFHAGKSGTPERLHGWLTRLVERLKDKPGGANMPIYITEIGWPNELRGDKGISREVARDYIARVLLSVRSVPQVKGVWWYTLQDYDRGFVGTFGLLEKDGTPKPSYDALKDVAMLIRKATK